MSSRRQPSGDISLQPYATSVIPRDAYKNPISPLMQQSFSKAGVGLLENFIVSGWEGHSRPNSSSHKRPNSRSFVMALNPSNTKVYGKIPTKPRHHRSQFNHKHKHNNSTKFKSTKFKSTVDNPVPSKSEPGEPTSETVNMAGDTDETAPSAVPTPETPAFLNQNATTIAATTAPTTMAATLATAAAAAAAANEALSTSSTDRKVAPVVPLQRPLPRFKLPSNDRAIQVLTIQYQNQLKKQQMIMSKQNTLLRRTHEKDLSNVVLAYDTRMDTLDNKIRVHARNNTKLNMMLEQLKNVYHSQCMEIKTFQAKIKLQDTLLKRVTSNPHYNYKDNNSFGASGNPGLSVSQHPDNALLATSLPYTPPGVWGNHLGDPANIDGIVYEGGRHGHGQGSDMYDRNGILRTNESDSDSDEAMSDSGGRGRYSNSAGSEDHSDEVIRMREEIQQYQEALAEASTTIEMLENRTETAAPSAAVQDNENTEHLTDSVNMYKKRIARLQEELQTEKRIRGRIEKQSEKSTLEIIELKELNEKLKKVATQMRTESDRIRQEVAISENKINTQLKGAAIQMKQTLKQCHMLEELIRPEITCNNCFDVLKDAQILYPCGHSFCDKCVDQMERPEDAMVVCALCQTLVPRADTCPNVSLQAICPRVAWWAEPISALKDMFNGFSGKEFVAQQTFAAGSESSTMIVNATPSANKPPVADARTTKVLVRIAGAIKETGKSVVQLFEEFDDDDGGTVDYEELKNGLEGINLFLPPKDFKSLISYADPNGDGEIEYHEFAELLDHMLTMREGRDHALKHGASGLDPMVSSARSRGY